MTNKSSFIDGKYSSSTSEKLIVNDKFSLKEIASVSLANKGDIEDAIVSSRKAFSEYSSFSAGQRHELIEKFINIFKSNEDRLVNLIVSEAGKPLSYAKGEFSRCVDTLVLALEECRRIGGEVIPMDFGNSAGRKAFTSKFPVGPILAISPFNFPLNLALHKIAPAFAAGCSVILKPSPYTPLSSLLLAEFAKEAGFPDGLLNVVICDNELSEQLVREERIKLLSFTGSPKIGWLLKSIAGKKKVILELGGNASAVIDETCDLVQASKSVALGAFLYSGQICISTQKVFIAESIYDEFKKLLISEAEKLVCGTPNDKDTIVGPIIDKVHVDRILDWINKAKENGAKILCGGDLHEGNSHIISPTIIEDYKRDDLINSDEVFGPVVLLKPFSSDDEVIDLVNDSSFGLQAGIFTNRLDFIKKCFSRVEVGGLIINSIPGFRVDQMPYGGVKDSGLGREGIKYAIEDMTEMKLLVI
ncbi:aldehyde dehydrogenase family protein [Halobacteriovorax sp.]|uniref:aldehyde dehydrogenase family protein n=1 Tax=Halobacteriovorax sp. TaxID=2020862 RepID=UPI0035689406